MSDKTSSAKKSRSSAAKRVAKKATTAPRAGSAAEGETEDPLRPGDPETHQAHPENPADSSVAHAAASGSRSAEGGYPSGEYDVTPPEKSSTGPQGAQSKDPAKQALQAHLEGASDLDQILKSAKDKAKLSDAERGKGLEALPQGALLEHVMPNRWRLHVQGTNRYGHGATATEAIESFILGTGAQTFEQQAAENLKALPKKEQQAIIERDQKAAERVGGTDPYAASRQEALKTAEKDAKADLPASNAGTDGPEKASARATK